MKLSALLAKARRSAFHRWLVNALLPWYIPFNRPHGFRVSPLRDGGMSVQVPYWRINRNHIRGIHACALATAAEMCSGLAVVERLDPKRYRLILRELRMQYRYQAKKRVTATAPDLSRAIADGVIGPLRSADSVDYASNVELHDADGNHVATGTAIWQVKPWSKVRTRP
ncbi:MAG: DUF4442 domain-containing protein [Flavobacteriales bacterium]